MCVCVLCIYACIHLHACDTVHTDGVRWLLPLLLLLIYHLFYHNASGMCCAHKHTHITSSCFIGMSLFLSDFFPLCHYVNNLLSEMRYCTIMLFEYFVYSLEVLFMGISVHRHRRHCPPRESLLLCVLSISLFSLAFLLHHTHGLKLKLCVYFLKKKKEIK